MDIQELRINSSVLLNGERVEIWSISQERGFYDIMVWNKAKKYKDNAFHSPTEPYLICCGASDIQPIPITEELLKELGFDNGWKGTFYEYKITVAEQCEFGYSMGAYDVSIKDVMTSSHIATIDGIKYLHELEQFVFLACKKELF